MNTGIIILAAGNSSRLGKPKQMLSFKGRTLLATTIAAAEETAYEPVILVLGAFAEEILTAHQNLNINYIINDNWQQGMSTSIAAGLAKIADLDPTIENVIIAVADQPFITPAIFEALVTEKESSGKNIVGSRYAETIGTPVLFNKQYFKELMSLKGDSGAKQIIKVNSEDVTTVAFELGNIDIDTETDYHNLTNPQ